MEKAEPAGLLAEKPPLWEGRAGNLRSRGFHNSEKWVKMLGATKKLLAILGTMRYIEGTKTIKKWKLREMEIWYP
ncbi:MAG: hypothetical protein IJD98_06245 [Oscillospiraceae bacterium]|nr:hypothetical protein [Oscillospiraceae bacterium]